MSRPNRNPLFPNSLAAEGIQGAGAKACGQCDAQDSAEAARVRVVVGAGIDALTMLLHRHAQTTDSPPAGFPEAADRLDEARDYLAQGGGL